MDNVHWNLSPIFAWIKNLSDIEIENGTIGSLSGSINNNEFFYSVTSFLNPPTIYHYNFDSANHISVFRKPEISGLNVDDFIIRQVFYPSKDGTQVPMYIVHHKNLVRNGNNPTLLYAYGGFSISMLPSFTTFNAFFVKYLNGVYAVANIRGGGEYGEFWHKSGMLFKKQNVFDDFHSAAEYLIKNNYTNRNKLVSNGRSNGGLLTGATTNQRPDLYGCSLVQVGVLDMLRYHKFTIGYAWIPEYGNPDEEAHFKNLIKYSPLHNIPVNSTQHTAILVTTGDHDDRVVPAHSFKFIAQLQHNLGAKLPNTPFLIRIDTNAGHGAGKSTEKKIQEDTDILSFIMNNMNLTMTNK